MGVRRSHRTVPYSIMVDSEGRRFANEAESYVDLSHHMLPPDAGGDYRLVVERRFAQRYLRAFATRARTRP